MRRLIFVVALLLACVLTYSKEDNLVNKTKLLGGLSPADALEYMKTTRDLVIIEVNKADRKWPVGFNGALWIPYDEIEQRVSEIPAGRPVILHCRRGNVVKIAYKTLSQMNTGIKELSYIAGVPPIDEYNSFKKE